MAKNSNNEFAGIDELLDLYKSKRPSEVFLLKNKERYDTIFKSIDNIVAYIKNISPDAKIEIEPGDMDPRAIYLTVTTDEIIIEDIKGFCSFLLEGSNIEIYPTKKNMLTMSILFNGAYSLAPSYEEVNNPFPEFNKKK
jgi:hypothetical protein